MPPSEQIGDGVAVAAHRVDMVAHAPARLRLWWYPPKVLCSVTCVTPVSSDADEHVERIGYYVGLGFQNLVFHAPGPDQARFLKLYSEHVLPRLRRRFG